MVNRAPTNEIYKAPYCKRKHKVPCVFKEGTSSLRPHFIVQTNSVPKILDYNYCYSYDTKYDYYIEDKIMLPQGQVELVCKIDSFHTFRDAILNLVVHEDRATDGQSNLLQDTQVPVMYNEVFKERYDIDMAVGDRFGEFEHDPCYVMSYFTSLHASEDGSGGDDSNIPSPKGSYAGSNLSAFARTVASNIAKKAIGYYGKMLTLEQEMKKKWNEGDKSSAFSCNICYTQNTSDPMAGGSNPNYFSLDRTVKFTPSRFDTPDLSELTVNGNVSTNLHYTPNYIYQSYIPQEVKDAGCKWYAWDCSQFAWRCAMFATVSFPIDIGSNTLGDGRECSTGSIAVRCLSKYVTYTLVEKDGQTTRTVTHNLFVGEAYSENDLMPGDIIIRGNISEGKRKSWWVVRGNYDSQTNRYTYVTLAHLENEPFVADTATREAVQARIRNMSGYSDFTIENNNDLVFVNHALVYIGEGQYIDSVEPNTFTQVNSASATYGINVNKNALHKGSVGKLAKSTSEFWGLRSESGSGDYHYLVFRPAFLAQDGQTVPYSQWHDLQNV